MTEFLDIPGGRIAHGMAGAGSLALRAHGPHARCRANRFLASRLAGADHRAAVMNTRRHGESRTGWDSCTRADGAGYVLPRRGHLGGQATIVAHSFAGEGMPANRQPELIEPGDEADVLVVSGSPLTDPAAKHQVGAVCLRGTALAGGRR